MPVAFHQTSRDDDRQVHEIVIVGIAEGRTAQNKRAVQQRTLPVLRFLHAVQVIGKEFHVIAVDLRQLFHLVRIVAVMAEHVMRIRHADFRIGTVADLAADHERAHSGDIRLHRQHLQIDHQPDVFGEVIGNPGRTFKSARLDRQRRGLRALDPLFDRAGSFQIFFQLVPVAHSQIVGKPGRVFHHEIEDRGLPTQLRQPAFLVERFAVAEQTLEHGARVRGNGKGDSGREPGDSVGIGAGIIDVAASKQARLLDTEFERRQRRRVAKVRGEDLVHGNARADIRAFGLFHMSSGEERGAGPAVSRRTIPHRCCLRVAKAGKDGNAVPVLRKRFESGGQFQTMIGLRGPIGLHDHAVRRVEHLKPLWPAGDISGPRARHHRLQERQSDRGAEAAQYRAAADGLACDHHFGTTPSAIACLSGVLRKVNPSLRTIPLMMVRMR